MDATKSLTELGVGDYGVVDGGIGRCALNKVSALTPTQIVVSGNRYRKDNGRKIGKAHSWDYSYIRLPREGEVELLEAIASVRQIHSLLSSMKAEDAVERLGYNLIREVLENLEEKP